MGLFRVERLTTTITTMTIDKPDYEGSDCDVRECHERDYRVRISSIYTRTRLSMISKSCKTMVYNNAA